MAKLAVLGLGIMGSGIAANLVRGGHAVVVHNRTADKATSLVAQGAMWAATPAEAAREAEVVFCVVGDDAASRAMWTGPQGALAGLAPGGLAVECSTLSLRWVYELQELARAAGVELVDAPLAGSKLVAQAGTLSVLVGATEPTLKRLSPILAAFAQNVLHAGVPGAGTAMKLVNNLVVGAQIAALGEGLALAEQLHLNLDLVGQVLTNGAPGSPAVKMKLPVMLAHDYADQHFALRWMAKDLRYALEAAEDRGLPLPVAATALQAYQSGEAAGRGDLDFAAVAESSRL